mgnify:CR=1 FL=1
MTQPSNQVPQAQKILDAEQRPPRCDRDKRVHCCFRRPDRRDRTKLLLLIVEVHPRFAPDIPGNDQLKTPSVQRMERMDDLKLS